MNGISELGPLAWPEGATLPPVSTLPELIAWRAGRDGDAVAVVSEGQRITYAELDERIRRTSAGFEALGLKSGAHIALLGPNSADWLVAALGAQRAGFVVDCFNTWARAWDLEYLLSAAHAEVLVTVSQSRSIDILGELRSIAEGLWTSRVSTAFPELHHLVLLGGESSATAPPAWAIPFEHLSSAPPSNLPTRALADDIAYVLYTSGTTSRPKAVPLRHRALIENGYSIGDRLGLDSDDRVWLGSPLFWSLGCANAVMAAFTHGARVVLQERFEGASAIELMTTEQCTAAYLLPMISAELIDAGGATLRENAALRKGLTIGTPEEVRQAIVELGIPELCNVYGSTETYGNCCVTPSTMPLEERLRSQGPRLPGFEMRVVDPETGDVVPLGDSGELQMRGRVMTGYIDAPELTTAAFTQDGWFHTGDVVRILDDESMEFIGRATEMIKTAGINVSPVEVETFLATHPGVGQVGVVGAAHPTRGEVVVAFVVLRSWSTATAEELREYCRDALAGYKVPWIVRVVDRLPTTVTGKLMRRDLIAPAQKVVAAALETRAP